MADNYVPKVGDRVRATNGENVLVGEVIYAAHSNRLGTSADIDIHGSDPLTVHGSDGWSFEPVVEPVTFKPLMVVRLADDALTVLNGDEEVAFSEVEVSPEFVNMGTDVWLGHGSNYFEFDDGDIQKLLAAGKAEVLFEGVDA